MSSGGSDAVAGRVSRSHTGVNGFIAIGQQTGTRNINAVGVACGNQTGVIDTVDQDRDRITDFGVA